MRPTPPPRKKNFAPRRIIFFARGLKGLTRALQGQSDSFSAGPLVPEIVRKIAALHAVDPPRFGRKQSSVRSRLADCGNLGFIGSSREEPQSRKGVPFYDSIKQAHARKNHATGRRNEVFTLYRTKPDARPPDLLMC